MIVFHTDAQKPIKRESNGQKSQFCFELTVFSTVLCF